MKDIEDAAVVPASELSDASQMQRPLRKIKTQSVPSILADRL
jgi:hypothetical protein